VARKELKKPSKRSRRKPLSTAKRIARSPVDRRGTGDASRAVEQLLQLREELVADWSQNEGTLRTGGVTCPEGDQPGERASQAVRISELGFLAAALRDVDAALARARHGLYGVCVDCRKPIAGARLEANPTASRCTECQMQAERGLG